jgi:formylglycine-generating enzyme required for sulfatase activity
VNRYIKLIYLLLILLIVIIIQIGIRTGERPDLRIETEGKEFKPMAQKIKESKEMMGKTEQVLMQSKVNEEHEAMVFIPQGDFRMGNPEGAMDEQPERKVFLDGYFIDKNEVTFAQFYAFVAATGHRKPRLAGYLAVDSTDLHLFMNPPNPVVGVSWYDASAYCGWAGKRLPTEAEWEKAAKGAEQRKWPWGNQERADFANLVGGEDGFFYTSPVGAVKSDRSTYGLYDMAGNAMEWVSDWYQEDYYQVAPVNNPKGPEEGGFKMGPEGQDFKVIRGASWNDSIKRAKTTIRFKTHPTYRDVTIGFRCARDG